MILILRRDECTLWHVIRCYTRGIELGSVAKQQINKRSCLLGNKIVIVFEDCDLMGQMNDLIASVLWRTEATLSVFRLCL